MKSVHLLVIFCLAFVCSGLSQANKGKTVIVKIENEISGKVVDATLEWPYGAIRRISTGNYQVSLDLGAKGLLQISKDGYFDLELKLDEATEKLNKIHEIKLIPEVPQLLITVVDANTDSVLAATIDLFMFDESSVVFSDKIEVMPYTIDLEFNKVHVLQVRCPGYFSFKDTLDYTNVYYGRERRKIIALVPLKVGNKLSLNNIYFKVNEVELTSFAKKMLDELALVLIKENEIRLEVGAHSDDIGNDEYNLELSDKRAKAVKIYLLEKGAQDKQLIAKGYGETAHLVLNTSEENRALNRRVEFKIISTN